MTAVVTAFPGISACQQITVQSPVELQVAQRNQQNLADVAISGVIEGSADVIEAKADLIAGAGSGKDVGWTVVAKGSGEVYRQDVSGGRGVVHRHHSRSRG